MNHLISNPSISVERFFTRSMRCVVAERKALPGSARRLDELNSDRQIAVALYLLTRHGRAAPFLWRTVGGGPGSIQGNTKMLSLNLQSSRRRCASDAAGGSRLWRRVAVGDLDRLSFSFVIRFRENILVESANSDSKTAGNRFRATAGPRPAKSQSDCCPRQRGRRRVREVGRNGSGLVPRHQPYRPSATKVVELYGALTIEEASATRRSALWHGAVEHAHRGPGTARSPAHVRSLSQGLLALLGAASEASGLNRCLKANTVKKRARSLFRQGGYYYAALPNMRDDRLLPLMDAFGKIVAEHQVSREALGVI